MSFESLCLVPAALQKKKKVHESTEKTTNARNRISRVETDEPERTVGGTDISSSLDWALPSL